MMYLVQAVACGGSCQSQHDVFSAGSDLWRELHDVFSAGSGLWRELCQSRHDVSLVQVVACGGSCVSRHNVALV